MEPTAVPAAPPTFMLFGQRLRQMPLTEVLRHAGITAVAYGLLGTLMPISPSTVGVAFFLYCLVSAGLQWWTLRGMVIVLSAALVLPAAFAALSAAVRAA